MKVDLREPYHLQNMEIQQQGEKNNNLDNKIQMASADSGTGALFLILDTLKKMASERNKTNTTTGNSKEGMSNAS